MQMLRKCLKNSVLRKLALAVSLMMAFLVALPTSSLADNWDHGHGKGGRKHGDYRGKTYSGSYSRHGHGSYQGRTYSGGYSRYGYGSGRNWGGNAYFGYRSVPRRIYVENRSYYQPYHTGTIFYGPHRHYHQVYSFPVWVNNAVAYRPYYYCGDQVFIGASAPLPRLAFGFGFGFPAYGGYVTYQKSYDNHRSDDNYYDDDRSCRGDDCDDRSCRGDDCRDNDCQGDDCYDQENYGD